VSCGERRRGEATECETGDGGRRFVASEPVEKSREDGQRDADRRGVARIVVVPGCQSEVIECGHGAATLWHPKIVGVHDRGEYEGQLWIAMDLVDGTDAAGATSRPTRT